MLTLVLALLVLPALAEDRILDFHSDIKIQPDASLLVHETIRVEARGESIKHGIFRDFPTRYEGKLGEEYVVAFNVMDVRRDGQPEPYSTSYISNGIRIRIGSESTLLSPGEYSYEITYTVTRELGFFVDHDELYWNVTGNGWKFPIHRASATVTLPAPVKPDDLKLAAFTGYAGARDQNFKIERINDTTVRFETTTALWDEQGLTIVVEFPKGLIAEPSAGQKFRWMLEENAVSVAGLVGLVVVFIYYFVAWLRVGRDPAPGTIVVSYEPPPGLSPAAMRYLERMGYDDRALVCAVVDLAVKKYLTIQQDGRSFRLTKLRAEDGTLPPEEHNLQHTLFWKSSELAVSAAEATTMSGAKTILTRDLAVAEGHQFFRKNRGWAWPGILLTVATLVAMVLSAQGPAKAVMTVLLVWLSIWTAVTVSVVRAAASGTAGKAAPIVVAAGLVLFELIGLGIFVFTVGLIPALIVLALIAANVFFISVLKAFTPAGRKLMDQVKGFKQYLVEVDSDRILRLNPPQKTPALFEKCLPFALALGVEQAWAKQFAGVLAQAAAAGAGATGVYSPTWYTGDWQAFDSSHFASTLSSDFSSAISSAASPPGSSSGGDGGGSSGGGGGGGGGGGW
jgi:uncharacterized membrane protein YgcG